MYKEYSKSKILDRSSWGSGPWDNEPDYVEWITQSGYPAYATRLDSGAWVGIVEAPYPSDSMVAYKLMNELTYDLHHHISLVANTDIEGICEYFTSFERWESPGYDAFRTSWWGPYRTLNEMKEVCENMARDILILNEKYEGSK